MAGMSGTNDRKPASTSHQSGTMLAAPAGSGPPSGVGGPSSVGPRRPVSFARRSYAPLRALIATPHEETRAAAERVLTNSGAELISTSTAGGILYELGALSDRGLTMVLLDPLLPGCDHNLIAMLRQHPHVSKAPVLLISNMSGPVVEEKMRALGADGFVLTSRGLLQLDTALKSWLERYDAIMAALAM